MKTRLRIGTRGSALALAQSRHVLAAIEAMNPGVAAELVTIRTSGDRIADRPLAEVGGKGLFVKEIEEALLENRIDAAVHSMKDLPAELAAGLLVAAVPPRENPGDVLIAAPRCRLDDLPAGAVVGTSSLRRAALLRLLRPEIEVVPLRGNVDTRLRKLREGQLQAIVLAAAGLRRLGLEVPEAVPLDPTEFLPAIGQGALAIETRADWARDLLAPLDDADARAAVDAERGFMRRAEGSCVTPMAAHASVGAEEVTLRAVILSEDGSRAVRGQRRGPRAGAAQLGAELAAELLDAGGADILSRLRGSR